MKKVCAITMVRDDEFFLRKWVSYYGSQLGEENLYVFFDGKDQSVPDFCGKANTFLCDRVKGMVARADKGRINFLSRQAALLFERYDIVIGTDVDEFLVVDPLLGMTLREYLSERDIPVTLSGLGVDVGQNMDVEQEIDASRPFLKQRHYGFLSARYTKTSVISKPKRWGSGFHRVKGHNYRIDPNLYLFHFGCIDMNMLKKRMNDSDRISNGWSRHLAKRARTILVVTRKKAREWNSTIPFVRMMQTIFRPVFAVNKPSTLGIKFVVRIDDRFSDVL